MEALVTSLNNIIWSPALVVLCLGAGLFYSILTRFAQLRHFREMWRLLFNSSESPEGISSFQALAVSLSGRVGVGNIAGVAAAIGFGGPGAVFWMWTVAFCVGDQGWDRTSAGRTRTHRTSRRATMQASSSSGGCRALREIVVWLF